MKNFKKISKFNISNEPIPEKIADKIIEWHMMPLQRVRDYMNSHSTSMKEIAVWASKNSCFRPYWWEIARGRSGNSQHCFGQKKSGIIYAKDKGASDITCSDFKNNKDLLLEALIEETEYTRLAVYNGFIHGDYKATPSGRREIYSSTSNSVWTLTKII